MPGAEKKLEIRDLIREKQQELDSIVGRSTAGPESLEHAVRLSREIKALKMAARVRLAWGLRGAA